MLKSRRFWIGLVVSLAFLALFLYQVDFSRIGVALRGAVYFYLVPGVLVYFLGVWFRALRWRQILMPAGEVSARRLYPIVVIGYMANDLLPMRAGELVRAYILGEKEGLSKAAILGTIALERVFDGLALLFFMAVIALFVPLAGWLWDVIRVMSLVFLGALGVLFALTASPLRAQGLVKLFLRVLPGEMYQPFLGVVLRFFEGLGALRHPGRLAAVFLLSVVVWLIEAGVFYSVGLAFGLNQPYYVLLLAMAVANLAITLPSSQGGIGPFEYFSAQTLMLFGSEASLASAYTIVVHGVLLVPVILAGLFHLWLEGLSLVQVVEQQGKLTGGYSTKQ